MTLNDPGWLKENIIGVVPTLYRLTTSLKGQVRELSSARNQLRIGDDGDSLQSTRSKGKAVDDYVLER